MISLFLSRLILPGVVRTTVDGCFVLMAFVCIGKGIFSRAALNVYIVQQAMLF
jgi:hypothetical protein